MKPKAIRYDANFEKQWLKFLKKLSPKEKEQLKERLSIFKEDAFDPQAPPPETSSSIMPFPSYSDRIVFRLVEDEEVLFVYVGSHDVCY